MASRPAIPPNARYHRRTTTDSSEQENPLLKIESDYESDAPVSRSTTNLRDLPQTVRYRAGVTHESDADDSNHSSDAGVTRYPHQRASLLTRRPAESCPDHDFIRQGSRGNDDVFGSAPASILGSPGDGRSASTSSNYSSKGRSGITSSDWRTRSSSQQESAATSTNWRASRTTRTSTDSHAPSYRQFEDPSPRSPAPISAENAQALLPPSSCVFVANLTSTASEEELAAEVTKVFKDYGSCWVKIRRDRRNMPHAFVQYELEDQAHKAIEKARNKIILGRPCRTEWAEANRTFLVSRRDDRPVTEQDVHDLVQEFGRVSKIWAIDAATKATYHIAFGFFVEFIYYDAGRIALANLREHEEFRFEQYIKPGLPRTIPSRTPPSQSDARAYMERYERDKRSIFVGNLPSGVTQTQVEEIFAHYGRITDVIIIARPSSIQGVDTHTFAFVEFENALSVRPSLEKHGYVYNNHALKVVQKDSELGGRQTSSSASRMRSPEAAVQRSPAAEMAPPRPMAPEVSPYAPWSPVGYHYMPSVAAMPQTYVPAPFYVGSPTYHAQVPRPVEQFGPAPTMGPFYPGAFAAEYYPMASYPTQVAPPAHWQQAVQRPRDSPSNPSFEPDREHGSPAPRR